MDIVKGSKWFVWAALLSTLGCASVPPRPPVHKESVEPGGVVYRGIDPYPLLGTPLSWGRPLPSVPLVDALSMNDVDLSKETGKVLFLSIVLSIDTPACEAQTHLLGEEGARMPPTIRRITISRDTPFAQKRFAQASKLTGIQYLSDYKEGNFGRGTGLLIDRLMLLARAIVLVDKRGAVRYIQVVPNIAYLPDMERAFTKAMELAKEE